MAKPEHVRLALDAWGIVTPNDAVANGTKVTSEDEGVPFPSGSVSAEDGTGRADLPETKAVLSKTISCPANPSAPWNELHDIWRAEFLPIQTIYRKLKDEVLGKG